MTSDLLDVNVLVAASDTSHAFYRLASQWMKTTQSYATTPITETGLVRCLMNPRIVAQAVELASALAVLTRIKANPRAEFWPDDSALDQVDLDLPAVIGYRQITDLHLVNLAAKNGGRLVTLDAKIARALRPRDQHLVHSLLPSS